MIAAYYMVVTFRLDPNDHTEHTTGVYVYTADLRAAFDMAVGDAFRRGMRHVTGVRLVRSYHTGDGHEHTTNRPAQHTKAAARAAHG